MQEMIVANGDVWDGRIVAWVQSKYILSKSDATSGQYSNLLYLFRNGLRRADLELDGDPHKVRLFAQLWATQVRDANRAKPLAGASINHTLSILSSFYRYALGLEWVQVNPIAGIERAKVHDYDSAVALDIADVRRALAAINRESTAGMRDYALLLVALSTGRRAKELRGLSLEDIAPYGATVRLTFYAKGGKVVHDIVEVFVAKSLIFYLTRYYGEHIIGPSGQRGATGGLPVWVSVSRNSRGKRLTHKGIADIYERRLGVGKVHTSRHTFAHWMQELGASETDIQKRLGHSNLSTTNRYLASIRNDTNPFGARLGELLGADDES